MANHRNGTQWMSSAAQWKSEVMLRLAKEERRTAKEKHRADIIALEGQVGARQSNGIALRRYDFKKRRPIWKHRSGCRKCSTRTS